MVSCGCCIDTINMIAAPVVGAAIFGGYNFGIISSLRRLGLWFGEHIALIRFFLLSVLMS